MSDNPELERGLETFFETAGTEEEWKTLAEYANQYSIYQIKALCKLIDIIHRVEDPLKSRLQAIYDSYTKLSRNYRTAKYMLMMKEFDSLKQFLGKGIEGKIQYDFK